MNTLLKSSSILIAALFIFSAICWSCGVRLNTTKSIPLGIYITSNKPASAGSYVIFCPPNNAVFTEAKTRGYVGPGFCPGDYGYIMKKVFAAENDVITVDDSGVYVNGLFVPLSKPLESDGADRQMPYYRVDNYALAHDQLLLMSDITGLSFDGRYFGLIHSKQINSVIDPVFTW